MIRIETLSTDNFHYINAYDGDVRVGKLGIEKIDSHKAKIVYVITDIKHINKGIATMLMNKAIEDFGGYDLTLLVKPMPRDGENIDHRFTSGLIKFYSKFGFIRTNELLPTMIRKANTY